MTTGIDIRDRLPGLLNELADSVPVDDTATDFDPDRLTVVSFGNEGRRTLRPVLGAAAATTLVIGGLVVIANRPERPGSSGPAATLAADAPLVSAPPESAPPESAPPPATSSATSPVAALTFRSIPPGFALTRANPDAFAGRPWEVRTRFYTADPDKPENAATLAVTTMPADGFTIDIPENATTVTVNAVAASIYDDPHTTARSLSYEFDGNLYTIAGYHVTDDQIITAANSTRPAGVGHDHYGAVVDPAGLPPDVHEVYIGGSWFERWFIGKNALNEPISLVSWDSDTSSLWAIALQQNPRWLPLNRIGWDQVTDTTIHGLPAFVVSAANEPDFLGVNWVEDGITYMVGSRGVDEAALTSLAEQLQPATAAERNNMATTNSTATPETDTTEPAPTATL